MNITSKLPNVGTTIFTVMSQLANKHQAINLSQGFPNFDCDERLKNLVSHYMAKGANQYAPMAGLPLLRERLAEKMNGLYGCDLHPESEITVTLGATEALFTAITAFVHPGDEVIIIEPAYDSYRPAIELAGGIPVVYELRAPDYRIDWTALRQLIGPKTRMLIINSPHNPTGTTLKAEDLKALAAAVAGTEVLVLSDEVYEHLVFDGQEHQSVLRYPSLWERSIVTYSFGKTYHNTGWRVGYCIAPKALMTEFRKVHQFNVFSITTPLQYALADYILEKEAYLGLADFYQQKRDQFLEALQDSPFQPLRCEGTYFQLASYASISEEYDLDFAKRMTRDYGVAVIPISVFYSSQRDDKVIRFCFAKTPDLLQKAGELLAAVGSGV
ncbi:MAG: methionine aminotransferase [Bacteroidota bacterium]